MFDWAFDTWARFGDQIIVGFVETFYMVAVAFSISLVLGTGIGMALSLCSRGGPMASPLLASPLAVVVNIIRSVPFILLLIIMAPVARALIGKEEGDEAEVAGLPSDAIATLWGDLVETSIAYELQEWDRLRP